MIIERCRELALRSARQSGFSGCVRPTCAESREYLHQQGLATPNSVANPFELRQFALKSRRGDGRATGD